MTASIAILGERALRRLRVAIVPVADRPTLNTAISPAAIATNALIELGVIAVNAVPPSQASIVPVNTIATTALIKLGVIASDETPSATDLALALTTVDAVHNALVAQAAVDWTSSSITTAVSEEYASLTAIHLAASFGRQADPAMVPLLENRIAAVSRVLRAQALAQTKVAQVQASLVSQANVSWDNTGIPSAVAEEYTQLTVLALASSFGQKVDPAMLPALEARVRRVAMILRAPDDAADAVQAIHDILVAQGLARWSVFDIPPAAELPYELLAANRLAPLFDQPASPFDETLAVRSLAQIIALPTTEEREHAEYF